MPNRAYTQKILSALKRHKSRPQQVWDALEQEMSSEDAALTWRDIDYTAVLEHDFGQGYRNTIQSAGHDALEAVLTSGTFNKMILNTIRHALRETPKEAYKLSGMVTSESKGECEGRYKDWGVFSDIKVNEVCELEMGNLWGIATDYQEHPRGVSVAAGLAWTREALCADPNGYLLQQVPKLRDAHDEWKEDRLVDSFIGHTSSYDRSGTLYDTYYESATATVFDNGGPWVNASGAGFTCGSDLEEVRDLFHDMVDLVHGRRFYNDVDNMQVITSYDKSRAVRPILLSTEVRCDEPCDSDAQTCTYIMTGDVARGGMQVNVTSYDRMTDAIVDRYGISAAAAASWMWFGPSVNEFLGWVYQIPPQITRCPISGDDCAKRIVARYDSLSKGYSYIKEPQKGLIITGTGTTSASAD